MHLHMQKCAWINKHIHTHTCCLHTSRFRAIEWKYRTLLIHNAEGIYGNSPLTECVCDAVQQSCCCSSYSFSGFLFLCTCSLHHYQFFHSPFSWWETTLSDVFHVFIKCSLFPVFVKSQGKISAGWNVYQLFIWRNAWFLLFCASAEG